MKILKIVTLFSFIVLFFIYCTKTDQIVVSTTAKNLSELLSLKTSTPPVIDGSIDAIWAAADAIEFTTGVPDAGNGLFVGYIGDKYTVKLKSIYDASYIYFLVVIIFII